MTVYSVLRLFALIGNCPLGNLNADSILTRFKGDAVVRNTDNLALNAADGNDFIARRKALAPFLDLLFLLVFRSDHKEIENRKQNDYGQNRRQHTGSRAGCGC